MILEIFNFKVISNLKTVKIMENIKILFFSSEESTSTLEVYANEYEKISIEIKSGNQNSDSKIILNKITAIRLVRELKKQIGILNQNQQI